MAAALPTAPQMGQTRGSEPANRGAEGGTRTHTARRPLAPQGFVYLARSSLVFPSVRALASANSEAKASAQRSTICRRSVANRRHLYVSLGTGSGETDRHGRVAGQCQLRGPDAGATGVPFMYSFPRLVLRHSRRLKPHGLSHAPSGGTRRSISTRVPGRHGISASAIIWPMGP